jgi:hypothetical protein
MDGFDHSSGSLRCLYGRPTVLSVSTVRDSAPYNLDDGRARPACLTWLALGDSTFQNHTEITKPDPINSG